jgi:tRNA dimethylallyltransferase
MPTESSPVSMMAPIIAIVGPTATGKTDVAAMLAERLNGDVLSCDSQLVYREFNIGVAKPTEAEKRGVTHHMIDVAEPTEQYSAGRFAQEARPLLDTLLDAGRPIIIAGGTGFYLRSLLQPDHVINVPPNPEFRETLLRDAATYSNNPTWFHDELHRKDPRRAAAIAPQDTKRIIRALEMIDALGGPIPETPTTFAYPVTCVGLTYHNRQQHADKISTRLDAMLEAGFYEEAVRLYEAYGPCPAIDTAHGYRHLIDVHLGKISLDTARNDISTMIRQYSKRQMTWFRAIPGITWFDVETFTPEDITQRIVPTLSAPK